MNFRPPPLNFVLRGLPLADKQKLIISYYVYVVVVICAEQIKTNELI